MCIGRGRPLSRAGREAKRPAVLKSSSTRNALQLLVYETKVSGDGGGLKYVWNEKGEKLKLIGLLQQLGPGLVTATW